MAFDPNDQLAEAEQHRDRLTEHMMGIRNELLRAGEELRYLAEEQEREQAKARTTVTTEGGAVRVSVDGFMNVQQIQLADRWYSGASPAAVGTAVLAALKEANGPATDVKDLPPLPPPSGITAFDMLHSRHRELHLRLDAARVKAAAPTRDVEIVYDGLGRPVQVTVSFTNARRPTAALLGERLTTTVRSAQKAVSDLRERTHQEALVETKQAIGMPLELPDGHSAVMHAFRAFR